MQLCVDPAQVVFIGTIVQIETRGVEGEGGDKGRGKREGGGDKGRGKREGGGEWEERGGRERGGW